MAERYQRADVAVEPVGAGASGGSHLGAASFLVGLMALVTGVFGLGLLLAPVAILLAIFALRGVPREARRRGGMASIGFFLGVGTLLLTPLFLYAATHWVMHRPRGGEMVQPETAPATEPIVIR